MKTVLKYTAVAIFIPIAAVAMVAITLVRALDGVITFMTDPDAGMETPTEFERHHTDFPVDEERIFRGVPRE